MQSKGRVEYLTEAVEFSLEKEKNFNFVFLVIWMPW